MHKGVHFNGIAPENSLDAIRLTSRIGAREIELDVMVTKDKELVLLHDATINSMFRNKADYSELTSEIFVSQLTFEELKQNYVFRSDDPAMRKSIPTLKEALLLCKAHNIYPMIELKFTSEVERQETLKMAIKILGINNFALTDYRYDMHKSLRNANENIALFCDGMNDFDKLAKYNLNYFPYYKDIDPKTIELIHTQGLKAYAFTVPKEEYDLIVEQYVDAILTDDIAPTFKKEYAIFENFTDAKFLNYTNTGIIENNSVKLNTNDYLEAINPIDSIYLGSIYFEIEFKGEIKIESNDFLVVRENKSDDYKYVRFQFLINNQKPKFSIISLADNTEIKSIWYAICKY